MEVRLIIGGVAAFGLVFVIIGAGILASQARFRRRAITTQGTIVALRAVWTGGAGMESGAGLVYRPTVRFTTTDGQCVEAESRTGTNPPPGSVGKTVTVRYDPANPRRFTTTSIARMAGCVAWGFILTGGLVFAVAAMILAAIMRL